MPSGVVVVATDCEDRLIAQYEYKYAIDKTILSLPTGGVEKGESVLVTAARELLEETGYKSNELKLVQTLYEYPSKADHFVYIVRAKNAKKVTDAVAHEATESISPVKLLSSDDKDFDGVFNTTYNISALALTLPVFLGKTPKD
jgi:ADP-ribose pyrophosphatase